MVNIGRGELRNCGTVSRAIRQTVCLACHGIVQDGEHGWVPPLVSAPVELVCAIIPNCCGGIVFLSCPDEEVEVLPARRCLGVYRAGIPLTDYEGHVGEIVTDIGKVSVESGLDVAGLDCQQYSRGNVRIGYEWTHLVSVRAPGRLAPGREDKIIWRIVVVLYGPRILILRIRPLKPLARLDRILSRSNERDHSLRIETSRIGNGLQEDVVELVDLGTVLSGGTRRLVDRLESDLATLARKLRSNLIPKPVELLFDHGDVGSRGGDVSPGPAVVVDVDNRVETSRGDHV